MSSNGPARLARELGEDRGDLGEGHAGLLGVAAVVEPDGEHLSGPWHRARSAASTSGPVAAVTSAAKSRNVVPVGRRRAIGSGPKRPPDAVGDVGDPIAEHEHGAAVDVGELHCRAPCRAGWFASRVRQMVDEGGGTVGRGGGAVEVEVGSLQRGGGVVLGEPAVVHVVGSATVDDASADRGEPFGRCPGRCRWRQASIGDEAPSGAVHVVERRGRRRRPARTASRRAGESGWMIPLADAGQRRRVGRFRSDQRRHRLVTRCGLGGVGDADHLAELHRELDRRAGARAAAPGS